MLMKFFVNCKQKETIKHLVLALFVCVKTANELQTTVYYRTYYRIVMKKTDLQLAKRIKTAVN